MRNQKQQFVRLQSLGFFEALLIYIRWPTTVTAKPKTSRQKQNTSLQNRKPHDKNKIPHGKTENLTAKTKYLTAKPKTSQQKPNTSRKSKYPRQIKIKAILFLPWGFWFCRDVFVFTMRFLVLPWCFCFCREVFGFAVAVVGHHKNMYRAHDIF